MFEYILFSNWYCFSCHSAIVIFYRLSIIIISIKTFVYNYHVSGVYYSVDICRAIDMLLQVMDQL